MLVGVDCAHYKSPLGRCTAWLMNLTCVSTSEFTVLFCSIAITNRLAHTLYNNHINPSYHRRCPNWTHSRDHHRRVTTCVGYFKFCLIFLSFFFFIFNAFVIWTLTLNWRRRRTTILRSLSLVFIVSKSESQENINIHKHHQHSTTTTTTTR